MWQKLWVTVYEAVDRGAQICCQRKSTSSRLPDHCGWGPWQEKASGQNAKSTHPATRMFASETRPVTCMSHDPKSIHCLLSHRILIHGNSCLIYLRGIHGQVNGMQQLTVSENQHQNQYKRRSPLGYTSPGRDLVHSLGRG